MHRHKKSLEQFWKNFRQMFVKSKMVRITAFISFVFIAITFALPVWRILPMASETPFIALHYNIYLGVDRFGPVHSLFVLPAMSLGFFLLNVFIQAHAYRRQKTLTYFFAAATPVITFILMVAMTLIVLINL